MGYLAYRTSTGSRGVENCSGTKYFTFKSTTSETTHKSFTTETRVGIGAQAGLGTLVTASVPKTTYTATTTMESPIEGNGSHYLYVRTNTDEGDVRQYALRSHNTTVTSRTSGLMYRVNDSNICELAYNFTNSSTFDASTTCTYTKMVNSTVNVPVDITYVTDNKTVTDYFYTGQYKSYFLESSESSYTRTIEKWAAEYYSYSYYYPDRTFYTTTTDGGVSTTIPPMSFVSTSSAVVGNKLSTVYTRDYWSNTITVTLETLHKLSNLNTTSGYFSFKQTLNESSTTNVPITYTRTLNTYAYNTTGTFGQYLNASMYSVKGNVRFAYTNSKPSTYGVKPIPTKFSNSSIRLVNLALSSSKMPLKGTMSYSRAANKYSGVATYSIGMPIYTGLIEVLTISSVGETHAGMNPTYLSTSSRDNGIGEAVIYSTSLNNLVFSMDSRETTTLYESATYTRSVDSGIYQTRFSATDPIPHGNPQFRGTKSALNGDNKSVVSDLTYSYYPKDIVTYGKSFTSGTHTSLKFGSDNTMTSNISIPFPTLRRSSYSALATRSTYYTNNHNY